MIANSKRHCCVCDNPGSLDRATEVAEVNSNVRQFAHERFTVWRCENCRSLHSYNSPDLDRYYRDYPFTLQTPNLSWRLITNNYITRLRKAGLCRRHTLLDYGCGSGLLVDELHRKGYYHAVGYDPYHEKFAHPAILTRQYDFVVLQDVIEHSENPVGMLDEVIDLTAPGGILCLGSPNAEAIDLGRHQMFTHSLHQPYHRNILSAGILRSLACHRGLTVEKFYDVYYADSYRPFANVNFCHYYARLFDNTLDMAFETYPLTWRLLKPRALFLAFLGRFKPNLNEMMFLFRKPIPKPKLNGIQS